MNAPHEIPASIGGADRYKFRNASDTPRIMRESPFGGWQAVKDAINGKGFKGNAATQYGQENESRAIDTFELLSDLTGTRQVRVNDGVYSATLDWLSDDGKVIAEIKVPYKGKESKIWQSVAKDADPSYYHWQVQHQLMLTDAEVAYLFLFDPTDGSSVEVEILRNPVMIAELRSEWDKFYAWLETGEKDPGDGWTENNSSGWSDAAKRYLHAKKNIETFQAEMEEAKNELIFLAEADKVRGCGVTLVKSSREGSIPWAKAIKALNIGLEPFEQFRGKPTEVFTINTK